MSKGLQPRRQALHLREKGGRLVMPSPCHSTVSLQAVPQKAFRAPLRNARRFTTTRPPARVRSVSVPCGSNGSIQLHIHHPRAKTSAPPPILIYLPPGPFQSALFPTPVAEYLSSRINATVVQIDYRWDRQHRFPTPVHDVLFGYQWILQNLVDIRSHAVSTYNPYSPERLGVLGELAGGGLAAMLALTECHTRGHRIAAAALNNPLLDWIYPETQAQAQVEAEPSSDQKKSKRRKSKPAPEADDLALDLTRVRADLFKDPQAWFDPFASPALFFRTAGIDVPKSDPTQILDDFDELSRIEQQDFMLQQLRLGAMNNLLTQENESTELPGDSDTPDSTKQRRASRRYPRADTDLILPSFCITSSAKGMPRDQADDFARLARSSMVRTDKLKHADRAQALLQATQRVLHVPVAGTHYWHQGWDNGVAEIAGWFKQVL